MLTLYLTPGASSMAPHIALQEIGVAFETRTVSLIKRENRTPDYLALNPCGTVPVLLIDGRVLTEVAAILYYLAKRFADAGLLPADDIATEARAIEWMSFIASSIHPARRQRTDQARSIWNVAEQRLNGRKWALDRYSIVDIHLFRLFWRYHWSLDLQQGECPALLDHYARMMARRAVQRVIETEAAIGYEAVPGRLPPPLA
jgi:glutathione S-transferase